jgi:holliday junction DNA helicase RuvB
MDFPPELYASEAPTEEFATAELPSVATTTPSVPATGIESGNVVRPSTWSEIIGQPKAKRLLKLMVQTAQRRARPLDHILMVGPSGTGKTTFAHVIAHEMESEVTQLEAPISADTLLTLADTMNDGDVLFVDEIHQQAITERRGTSASTKPEVLFSIMEDFTMPTENGLIPFPHITFMGATTDEGMLPDAFINRFPIRPQLTPYTKSDMNGIVQQAGAKLDVRLSARATWMFAGASRGIPREAINYVRNAAMLTSGRVTPQLALTVLRDLNGVTLDGLTRDMQAMLTFLYTRAMRTTGDGEIRYQASISSIATAIGKSRDQKAVALRIEPHLIKQGYVQVLHGGRALTDSGVERAQQLLQED